MPEPSIKWDPQLFARAETLEWRSRVLVEGFLQGLHRSRLRGFSSEFAQYKPYIQGDDLRYADWRAYGRLDRLYIRQFEAETNLRSHFFVDTSNSMAYCSEGGTFRKFDYAALLAASLMRLLLMQHDAFGLSLGKEKLSEYLPARLTRLHFSRGLNLLETAKIGGECNILDCMHSLGELLHRRGLIILFTDAWGDLDDLIKAFQRLRYEQHEVCLIQVVDPQEIEFSFQTSQLFEDMETGTRLPITPDWNRNQYLKALDVHQARLVKNCRDLGVTHLLANTNKPPFEALTTFISKRESYL
jgi:uncharacterized protein (DUF58 family)